MKAHEELGVNQVAQRVHARLRRYLEAQYHIRNPGLIEERRLVLEEPGGISQRPFIEVTPSYASGGGFDQLNIPILIRDLLQGLVDKRIGVYPPYKHQADALERFFADGSLGDDLIVATGTGSGKTEAFLYSILGTLALEGEERRSSFALPGVRALLLYPMNALVSDQTSRLRLLLGNREVAQLFAERWGRHPRFGMYTSRTPYPGTRNANKDRRHLDGLLSHYEALETSQRPEDIALVRELRARGKWPAKDVVRFYARELEEKTVFKTGKKTGQERTLHHWKDRFFTQPEDRELLTRHEMQEWAPDLLITNYSMLEYMLLRPIERPIFQQTAQWLASDPRNQFILVLDEAHMYRGAGGAEVGLLIRRLMSRLGIGRDRLRCILTSASLGSEAEAGEAGRRFGFALTGQGANTKFAVIQGTREERQGDRPGSSLEAKGLAEVSPAALAAAGTDPDPATAELERIARTLGWDAPPPVAENVAAARRYVGRCLTGFGPLEKLIGSCSGDAKEFGALARTLFPDVAPAVADRATDGLFALGTFARRSERGREEQPLLPTRVHLLYRGLPSLHVCVNPTCDARRTDEPGPHLAGRLYTEPRTQCECGARVYELLTHRDCGTTYVRVFGTGAVPDFFWHEKGGRLGEFGQPLHELHLLLEEPHPDQRGEVVPVVLDVQSGRALSTEVSGSPGTRLCYRPANPPDDDPTRSTFGSCPVCTRRTQTGNTLKIMDLATKGEQPFANLVREQFVTQLPTKPLCEAHPNEGRKALLFSDGRQKAARLARDLPREVERDSFREALALAVDKLIKMATPADAVLNEVLYGAFVAVCAENYLHLFDGTDQGALREECDKFRIDYDGDLELAFDLDWRPTPTARYRQSLAREIGDPYYSLVAACAATVEVRPLKLRLVQRRVPDAVAPSVLNDVITLWLGEMLRRSAFDPSLARSARLDEFPYFQPIRASDGLKRFFSDIRRRAGLDEATMTIVRDALYEVLTSESVTGDDTGRLVMPDCVQLKLTLEEDWLQCVACGTLQIRPTLGGCQNCGRAELDLRSPDHPYMVARKGFFREPLRQVLRGERPVHITAEEHTAQLSQRDAGVVYATTEQFELRFQDVPIRNDRSGKPEPPVDVLSCTTTMEVGIDIGSLSAVGLRTVPPQRENYQQRAGRSGRRGTSVSSVLTFAQGGAHDAFYFANPAAMISGAPRAPRIKSDNRRLARRHIHSHLLQTFFHNQISELAVDELTRLLRDRPGIMSAFGSARDFFSGDDSVSYAEFETWLRGAVLIPTSRVVDEIATWLPPELYPGTESLRERMDFVREVAGGLHLRLEQMASMLAPNSEEPQSTREEGEDTGSLLDLLFDEGLLPSYAFPTDLSAFVVQEWASGQVRTAERPQMSRAQALSEYAPGRLLVINKKTYRVGGVFVEGRTSSRPAEDLFAAELPRYVGCPRCSFVRLESRRASETTTDGAPCPVCAQPLFVKHFVDPPAFTPENGRSLRERDREQDITYASSAQLPELVGRDEFRWMPGPGKRLQHAHGEDILLVVANKGKDSAGFSICQSCGAAWLDGDEPAGSHPRPFLLPNYVRARENATNACTGEVRTGLFLAHDFRTDLLLVRISVEHPFDFSPEQPWLYDALATFAEALALGASFHLDIDPGELSAGFRLLPPIEDFDGGLVEVYLYDTASGGAGYAADAGRELAAVLDRTAKVLEECPANCERSCTKCLRHYGNRFLHGRLDRRLASSLLRYAREGDRPAVLTPAEQSAQLRPLRRFLELDGWAVESDLAGGRPLVASSPSGRRVAVGTYPALLAEDAAVEMHSLRSRDGEDRVLLPAYLVAHDLPSAFQRLTMNGSVSTRRPRPSTRPPARGSTVELPVRQILSPTGEFGTVRLQVSERPPDGAFAARVPSDALIAAEFAADSWLVLQPIAGDKIGQEDRIVVLRSDGTFQATNASWTIARVKFIEDSGQRLQLLYGRLKGRQFRPERVARDEVSFMAKYLFVANEVR